jgi:hypothetical protein
MSLRAMVNNPGVSGKAIAIQGICDMVEEYLGVYRDIFRREFVKSRAILDGALLMWQKKQKKVAQLYLDDEVTFEDVTEMDLHYIDLYYLYPEPAKKTLNQHMNDMTFVNPFELNEENNEEMTEEEQVYWDEQIALQPEQYAADEAEYAAYLEEENKRDCEMEYWSSYYD